VCDLGEEGLEVEGGEEGEVLMQEGAAFGGRATEVEDDPRMPTHLLEKHCTNSNLALILAYAMCVYWKQVWAWRRCVGVGVWVCVCVYACVCVCVCIYIHSGREKERERERGGSKCGVGGEACIATDDSQQGVCNAV
jgi:hypothetical protein